jgi:DNA-binding transcriptional MerR regulator
MGHAHRITDRRAGHARGRWPAHHPLLRKHRVAEATGADAGGYRRYPERTIEDLVFIRKAQALGFSLEEVSEIVTLTRSGKAPVPECCR